MAAEYTDGLIRLTGTDLPTLTIQVNNLALNGKTILFATGKATNSKHPRVANGQLGYFKYFADTQAACIYDFYTHNDNLIMIIKAKYRQRYNISDLSKLKQITQRIII